jgi:ubiquinol-cytochrome c reductase cytochrome b subunit
LAQNEKISSIDIFEDSWYFLITYFPFGVSRTPSSRRIGPHNFTFLSVLFGNLLGDAHCELRSGNPRFSLHMSSKNMAYLNWLHNFYSNLGYCSQSPIKYKRQIGKSGKIYFSEKLNLYTFSSLRWVYSLFYSDKKKVIPKDIKSFLTPLTIAVWLMDDGAPHNKGIMFSTYCFT